MSKFGIFISWGGIHVQVAQWYRICLPMQEMQEMQFRPLGGEDLLEEEMATHSSTITWKTPWTEELAALQSMGLKRIGHN